MSKNSDNIGSQLSIYSNVRLDSDLQCWSITPVKKIDEFCIRICRIKMLLQIVFVNIFLFFVFTKTLSIFSINWLYHRISIYEKPNSCKNFKVLIFNQPPNRKTGSSTGKKKPPSHREKTSRGMF